MDLPVLLSILSSLFFGGLAVFFSLKEEKLKKTLLEQDEKYKQRLYEITILKQIQDRIGYELDIENVIDVITGSLRNLFPYSSASSLIKKGGQLVFKSYVEEKVSRAFVEKVKQGMVASFSQLSPQPLPTQIDEILTGSILDDSNLKSLNSFFHIPLIVNNEVLGLISISSTKPNLYKEDEMTLLYQITNQASNALARLQYVLTTEKGKLMAMISSLVDGLFMIDGNNNLLIINDSAKILLNIRKENLNVLDILEAIPHEYNFADKIKEAISQNKNIEEKEIKLQERTVQVFITPVFDVFAAKVLGASVLLHDITLEKNLEEMKEEFTNVIVHELRAPLTAIKGASKLMESAESFDKEEQTKLLNLIYKQSAKLLQDVASILDVAKLEAGKFTVQKREENIEKIINEKIQFFNPSAKEKNIELTAQIPDNLPHIPLDASRIGQVLNNLISNSLKFTPEGGSVVVSAIINDITNSRGGANGWAPDSAQIVRPLRRQDEARLSTGGNETGDRTLTKSLVISVSDNGIGIPKEKQEAVFSKFYQAHHPPSGLKHLSDGTGLGLYIAKGIIEAHGGSISINSDLDSGTTVTFTIPLENKQIIQ